MLPDPMIVEPSPLTTVGRVLLFAGLVLAAAGALILLGGHRVFRLGRLPGDILIQRPGFTLFLPLGTCLVLSLLISVIAFVVGWMRR